MKQLVLITRPAEDAEKVAQLLRPRFDTFSEPVLTIRATQEAQALVQQAQALRPQAIIATSRHAVPLVFHAPALTAAPCYAAGGETAQAARRVGFADVRQAANVEMLLPLVMKQCSPAGGPLVYLRGRDISEDIVTRLKRQGFTAVQHVVYEAEPAREMTPELVALMMRGGCHIATFLSRRTAGVFMDIAVKAGVSAGLAGISAVVISEAVGEMLGTGWKSIHVAAQPTLQSVVEAVDKLAPAA